MLTSALLFLHTFSDRYEFNPLLGDVSTVFFPRIVLVALFVLAAVLTVRGTVRSPDDGEEASGTLDVARLSAVFGAICLSAVILWLAGLVLGGPLVVALTAWTLGYRNPYVLAAVAVILSLLLWAVLGEVAGVSVPRGAIWNWL